jgi:hypothetical protein
MTGRAVQRTTSGSGPELPNLSERRVREDIRPPVARGEGTLVHHENAVPCHGLGHASLRD